MREIRIKVKNGMDWEHLTIDLDKLEEDGKYRGETSNFWVFHAELVTKEK